MKVVESTVHLDFEALKHLNDFETINGMLQSYHSKKFARLALLTYQFLTLEFFYSITFDTSSLMSRF